MYILISVIMLMFFNNPYSMVIHSDEDWQNYNSDNYRELTHITIFGNVSKLPIQLENCTKLREFNLYNTKIDSFPSYFRKLKSIESIYLERNWNLDIVNSLETFSSFKNLVELSIVNMPIDSLPEEIGKLESLKQLYLNNLGISHLSKGIGNLINLESLVIKGSALTEIPNEIGKLTNLKNVIIMYSPMIKYCKFYSKFIYLTWKLGKRKEKMFLNNFFSIIIFKKENKTELPDD